MASERIFMPKLGMHMTEGAVSEWLVADGEQCTEGAPVVEIETDKVTQEVEAPASGQVRIIVPAGTTVDVGAVLGEITSTPATGDDERSEHGWTGEAGGTPA
ncbi:lipoyl domain-containing protein [Streptomyces sp. NPDC056716]|uniref:lipoyl domain-containing protein n=1 Tax=unclassified Streptomyces TaxID=2593676 RepID=UPI0036974CD4